jgi:aryl-alcohol dehydrogenase-like predicted oxidoreductase
MEITLGTANFGLKYGVLDSSRRLTQQEVNKILFVAENLGINHFDMAIGYGNIEEIISNAINVPSQKKYTTKVGQEIVTEFEKLISELEFRSRLLGVTTFENIILHDSRLLNNNTAIQNLKELKKSGLARNIGVSIYEDLEVSRCLDLSESLTVLQLPFNLLSRNRFHTEKLKNLADTGVNIQVRSVFLQGILLSPVDEFPDRLEKMKPAILKFHESCEDQNLSPIDALTGFIRMQNWCQGLVVGVNSSTQLVDIWESFHKNLKFELSRFPILDKWLQDPRNWSS